MQENNLNDQHRSFLNKRGITDKVIDAFSIASVDVPHLRINQAIAIPVRHIDGEHSFNKYRRNPLEGDVKPKYLYDKGGKVTLYGADTLVAESSEESRVLPYTQHRVVITEGELDTLVCWSLNIPAVSSTGGAMSFQEEWVELLKGYEVFICFDNDDAGHKGAIKVLDFLPDAKIIFIPSNIPGVKDISDYVAHGGDFHSLMKSAKGYTDLETVKEESQIIAGQWGDNKFHRLYIEHHDVPNIPSDTRGKADRQAYKGDDKVLRAKSTDCTSIGDKEWIRAGRYMKSSCPWHNDSAPSLTYYPEPKNNMYCFACGKYADSIDLYMELNNLSGKEGFKKAVKDLNSSV